MIISFLINGIVSLLTTVFGSFPSLPDMPAEIVTAGDWIIGVVGDVSGFLSWIYGGPLFAAILLAIVALLNFESIYHLVIWVLKKIPALNFK